MLQRLTDVRISPSFLLALLFARYRPDYDSVRAKPLAKPIRYRSLTPEIEIELVRAYHDDGDLDALEWLVGAHRPMVVSMAKNMWRRTGTPLKVLVEYGMMGLRLRHRVRA
jgi:DNA-directed RNA polymerase sigma subunit (sigma70/sigma32)